METIKTRPIGKEESSGSEDISTRCEACNMVFQTAQELAAHLFFSFSLDSEVMDYFLMTRSIPHFPLALKEQVPRCSFSPNWNESLYTCKQCNRKFKNYKGLQQHIGKMHFKDIRSCGCWLCGKRFKSKYALKMHSNQVHKKSTAAQCEVCSQVFYNKYVRNQHMAKTHDSNCELRL